MVVQNLLAKMCCLTVLNGRTRSANTYKNKYQVKLTYLITHNGIK